MWVEMYCMLVRELRRALGTGEANATDAVVNLEVKGVPFSISYGGKAAPHTIQIRGDFGPLPEEQRELALCRLLELNMFMFSPRSMAFTFEPQSRHVVLKCSMDLESASVGKVIYFLGDLASMAADCQASWFLSDKEKKANQLFSAKSSPVASKGTASRLQARFGSGPVAGVAV